MENKEFTANEKVLLKALLLSQYFIAMTGAYFKFENDEITKVIESFTGIKPGEEELYLMYYADKLLEAYKEIE